MTNIVKGVKNTAKNQAIAAAKAMAREPSEFVNTAKHQIIENTAATRDVDSNEKNENDIANSPNVQEVKKRDQTRIRELESELKEIEKAKLIKALQQKISQGIPVYLEDYQNLSIEEKQVLKAQIEAVNQKKQQEILQQDRLAEPQAKPSRKIGQAVKGMKGKLEQLSKKSEIRMPPSG